MVVLNLFPRLNLSVREVKPVNVKHWSKLIIQMECLGQTSSEIRVSLEITAELSFSISYLTGHTLKLIFNLSLGCVWSFPVKQYKV